MSANHPTDGWLGYDWFKLIVALLLALLLLWFGFGPASAPPMAVVVTPVPAQPAAPTAAPAPSPAPTLAPIAEPTAAPTVAPTAAPTAAPTVEPTVAPTAAPTPVTALAIIAPSDGGEVPFGNLTISGTGPVGSTLEVLNDGKLIGVAIVLPDGTWSMLYVPDKPGPLRLAVRPKGESTNSAPARVVVAAPPRVPAATTNLSISVPAEGATLPVGAITISGTGPAGNAIEILNGDQVIGETIIKDDGTWSITYTPAAPGTASLAVRPKDAEAATTPVRITIGAGVQTTCATLAIGCEAWVTRKGGFPLRMRSAAGTNNTVLVRLPVGTQLTLLDGPAPATGFTWWHVKTTGGREGWVAGENLVLQPD